MKSNKWMKMKKRWMSALMAMLLATQMVAGSVPAMADNAVSGNGIKQAQAEDVARETVTYNSLEDYLTDVTIMDKSFKEKWEGDVVLNQGTEIGIDIRFTLPPEGELTLTEENCFFTYNLGNVVAVKDGVHNGEEALDLESLAQANGSKMTGDVSNLAGNKVGTYVLGNDGIVTMDFTYAIEHDLLTTVYSMPGFFRFNCALNEDAFEEDKAEYVLKFSTSNNAVNPTVTVDDKPYLDRGINVTKTGGEVDLDNHTVAYTITVENTGTEPVSNLTVHDIMGGSLSYDNVNTSLPGGVSAVTNANGVDFEIASVAGGDTVTITYYAKIADSAYDGNSGNLGNKLTATVEKDSKDRPIYITEDEKTETPTVTANINKDVVQKGGVNNGDGTVTWTIRVNQGSTPYDISGLEIKDTLAQSPTAQSFAGDIVITNDRTSEVLATIPQPGIGATGFDYTFPDTGTPITDSFTIQYTTNTDQNFIGDITLENEVTATEDGESTPIDTEIGTVSDKQSFLSKRAIAYDDADEYKFVDPAVTGETADVRMRWESVIEIPNPVPVDPGVTLTYEDTINPWMDNLDNFVLDGSDVAVAVKIKNGADLTAGADYTLTTNSQDYGDSFKVEFDNDFLQTYQGEKIVIAYETIGNMDGLKTQTFTNHANAKLGPATETVSASRTIEVETDETYVEKAVSSVNSKEHSVTWCVVINSNDWNSISTKKNWKNVKLTDVVENMGFYGYKSGSDDWQGSVFIQNGSSFTYRLNADGITTSSTPKDASGNYTTTMEFDLSKAERIQNWPGITYPDHLTSIKDTDAVRVYYTTVLDEEDFAKYNCDTTYSNEVTFEGTDADNDLEYTDSAETTATMEQKVIDKADGVADSLDGRKLHYSIDINPDALKLSKAEYNCYRVEDQLPEELLYVADSMQVINTKTGTALAVDEDVDGLVDGSHYEFRIEGQTLILMVPDETALTMKYEVYTLGQKGSTYTYVNSVVIPEPYVEEVSFDKSDTSRLIAGTNAGLSGSIVFYIDKVNANIPSKRLAGAKFKAVEYEYNSGLSSWVASGKTFYATTGATGVINSFDDFRLESDDGSRIAQNRIYEISEVSAPDGYAKTSKVYKILVIDETAGDAPSEEAIANLPADTVIAMAGLRYVYENTPQNNIKIYKQYYDAQGDQITDLEDLAERAKIHIYKGNYTLEQCENDVPTEDLTVAATAEGLGIGSTMTKNEEGEVYSLQNLPADTYTVYEKTAPAGYQLLDKVYHFTVLADGTIRVGDEAVSSAHTSMIIENKQIQPLDNRLEIDKTYYDYADAVIADVEEEAQAVFYIRKTHDKDGNAVAEEAVKMSNHASEGKIYFAEDLEPGTYEVTEKASDIYDQDEVLPLTVTVSADGKLTVSSAVALGSKVTENGTTEVEVALKNEMKNPVNKLEIRKQYKDPDGALYTDVEKAAPNGDLVTIHTYKAGTKFVLEKKNASDVYEEVIGTPIELELDPVSKDAVVATLENLEPGAYRITETQTPDTFFVAAPVEFVVTEDYHIEYSTTKKLEQTINIVNQQYENAPCRIQFIKSYVDQDGKEVSDELPTIIYSTTESNVESVTSGTYDSGETVLYKTLPANGILEELNAAGDYFFKEIKGKDGYQLFAGCVKVTIEVIVSDAQVKEVSYTGVASENPIVDWEYADADKDSVTIQVENLPNTNQLTLTKKYYQVDGTTEIAYGDLTEYAEFTLYRKNSESAPDTSYVKMAAKLNDAAKNAGTYVISGLNPGYYKLEETKVPAGFAGADALCFEVNETYEVVNASTVSADGTKTAITLTGSSVAGGKTYTYTAKNIKLSNRFVIEKSFVDYSGNAIVTPPDPASVSFAVTGISPTSYSGTMTYVPAEEVYEIKDLPDGTYKVTEAAPTGFAAAKDIRLKVSNGKIYALYTGTVAADCVIGGNNTTAVSAKVTNHPMTNKLEVRKSYLAADGTPLALNSLPDWAVFYIEKADGTRVGTMLRSAVTYTYGKLEPGNYRIREEVPTGFEPPAGWTGAIKPFVVSADYKITGLTSPDAHEVSVDVENKRMPNRFVLTKTYRDAEGGEILASSIANKAQFTVKKAGIDYCPVNYDSGTNLYTVENLLPGTYEIEETYTPDGFEKAGNIKLVVSEDGKIRATYLGTDGAYAGGAAALVTGGSLVNRALSASIMIRKSYEKDGAPMSYSDVREYAKFSLYKNKGAANEQNVSSKVIEVDVKKGSYRIIDLTPGTYTLTEEKNTYFKTVGDIIFTVSTGGVITGLTGATKTDAYTYVLDFNNVHKANKIVINKKYYDYTDTLVADVSGLPESALAQFELYRIEGSSRVKVDAVDASDITAGIYEIKDIPAGNYEIKEVAGENYKPLEQPVTFTVDDDWNVSFDASADPYVDLTQATGNDAEQTVTVSNYKGNVFTIDKTFYDWKENEVDDTATFRLWKVKDPLFVPGNSSPIGVSDNTISGNTVEPSGYGFAVGTDGKYVVKNLPQGKYAVTEDSNEIYETPYAGWYVYFEVDATGKIKDVAAYYDNAVWPMMVSTEYLEDASSSEESKGVVVTLKNKRKKGANQLKVTKKYMNADGKDVTTDDMLSETQFALVKQDGTKIALSYDETLKVYKAVNIPEGSYALTETKHVKGYETKATVAVKVDGDAMISLSYVGDVKDCEMSGSGTSDAKVTIYNRQESDEPKDSDDPDEPEDSEDPDEPDGSGNPGEPGEPPTTSSADKSGDPPKLVKTGDSMPIVPIAAGAIVSLILAAVCAWLLRKNRRES